VFGKIRFCPSVLDTTNQILELGDSNCFGFYRNIEDWRTRPFCASFNVSQEDKLLEY